MIFTINGQTNEVSDVDLKLKGNIDGEMKDDLSYEVSKGRMVEHSLFNTDIAALAEVLKSLDYSDKEILEFAQWYYNNNN
ncbi:hypothetical protein A5880_001581 [Enterococcus sp. 4G2_DIV0659]|uniref:Uncharacterized protein n=2 Tax=Candidatus Enterococcus mansonii TaxID=1834181 RepID=A0A242CF05_9ENTE|nr:hypothetical protein A5880_001500 [Enterococcus sp. 4G2_DIV0659]